MGAGKPDWAKLHEMGKLPKDARGNVSGLAELDAAEKKIKELEAKIAELSAGGDNCKVPDKEWVTEEPIVINATGGYPFKVKCEAEGCDYTGGGRTEGIARNILRMHGRMHEGKKEE